MNPQFCFTLISATLVSLVFAASGRAIHVAATGDDANAGTRRAPLKSIQRAADLARPGDVVKVHGGIYREWVNPPLGGESDKKRITFEAEKGQAVEIRGSEPVRNWTRVERDVWKAVVPNSTFGKFNPYKEQIRGDWFNGKGRPHHLGAVYLNGEWLVEAAKLDEVMAEPGTPLPWLNQGSHQYLLNLAWFQIVGSTLKTPASAYSAQSGVQTAACAEGGDCIGWIEPGDWVRFDHLDVGNGIQELEFRVASASDGGVIEIRAGKADGELLGVATVPATGDWQSWTTVKARTVLLKGKQTLCFVFRAQERRTLAGKPLPGLWFAEVKEAETTIWAQFPGVNPNDQQVEVNVRPAVFYPDKPGRNFITVRGFTLRNAATQWAPPTAEQIGLIGTHWSKGWIIENNTISHSICSGVSLGKHGDQYDNTSADTAEGYVKTIERGLARGWNRDTIGHHIVRNNTISHCEQTGIVGSLGSAFCTVTGNTIHDIHVRQLFTGAEMAGIKFHGAIDTVISSNHIHNTCLGLWLDWMAQGTRVSANVFHDNGRDLFVEVNHGPFVVDNNVFLSPASLLDVSEGGAYIHNLFNGTFVSSPEPNRDTPFHPAHSTTMAGLTNTKGGDNRFYNNLFIGRGDGPQSQAHGLAVYDPRERPLQNGGNVFYNSARPYGRDNCFVTSARNPELHALCNSTSGICGLQFKPGTEIDQAQTKLIDSAILGKATVSGLGYENADATPLKIDRDFFGKKRDSDQPSPGPFEKIGQGLIQLRAK